MSGGVGAREASWMALGDIQPSQLWVSAEKLAQVQKRWPTIDAHTFPPLPVKRLGDRVVMTDGHTKALAGYLSGLSQIRVYWDEDDLDWEAYEICVAWCQADGIRSVADLKDRVVSEADYERLWYGRCRAMHQELAAERRRPRPPAGRARSL